MDQKSKSEKVHHVFESISTNYDKMNAIISFQRHKAWRKDVMKQMNVSSGADCLDVCCGTGDWSLALSEAVGEEGNVIGLDFSQNMLAVGEDKKNEQQVENVTFVHGNAMDLPYDDNQFDYVTIGFGLRNVPNYRQVLNEMRRVVKPGGQVVCLETSQPTLPVFKQLYFIYFKFVMPLLGKMFAKSYNEYAWLNESTQHFPSKKELKDMFLQAGFSKVTVKSYTLGVAAMHLGFK